MKNYCSKGHITEYTLNKPKFCSQCGESFDSQFITPAKIIPLNIPTKITKEEPVIDEESERLNAAISNISELEVEITPSRHGTTLKEIAFGPRSDFKTDGIKHKKLTKKQKKEQVNLFLKETSTLGKGNSVNIGGDS